MKNVIIVLIDLDEKKSKRQWVAQIVERVRDALLEEFDLDK